MEGHRQLAFANTNTFCMKHGEIYMGSVEAVLAIGFLSSKICWVFCRAGHWEIWLFPLHGWYW